MIINGCVAITHKGDEITLRFVTPSAAQTFFSKAIAKAAIDEDDHSDCPGCRICDKGYFG